MIAVIVITLALLAHTIVQEISFDSIIRSHLNQNENNIDIIQSEGLSEISEKWKIYLRGPLKPI